MRALLALSLFLNFALAAWIALDFTERAASAPVVHSNAWKDVSDKLGRSLESQATGLRKQVALRDSLAHGGADWLESQERRDMLSHAQALHHEALRAFDDAGTIPVSNMRDYQIEND